MSRWVYVPPAGAAHHAAMTTKHSPAGSVGLVLRADCSLMIAVNDRALEITLTPGQLLQLAIDMLRVATQCDPALLEAAMHAMANTYIVDAHEVTACATAH